MCRILSLLFTKVKALWIRVDQGKITRDYIDRQLENHNHASRGVFEQQALKQQMLKFKESLFFPEILSRKEQISDAHRGTCSWIFGPPESNSVSHDDTDHHIRGLDE